MYHRKVEAKQKTPSTCCSSFVFDVDSSPTYLSDGYPCTNSDKSSRDKRTRSTTQKDSRLWITACSLPHVPNNVRFPAGFYLERELQRQKVEEGTEPCSIEPTGILKPSRIFVEASRESRRRGSAYIVDIFSFADFMLQVHELTVDKLLSTAVPYLSYGKHCWLQRHTILCRDKKTVSRAQRENHALFT